MRISERIGFVLLVAGDTDRASPGGPTTAVVGSVSCAGSRTSSTRFGRRTSPFGQVRRPRGPAPQASLSRTWTTMPC
ncbi:hypothetical protein FTX61_10000 [Nitriliruptoraceae bacterium ZYF776]|nr:hypothetical protein [Profundirhabdus halotolerans]